MKSPIGSPTKSDKDRFSAIQEHGCLACRIEGRVGVQCDIHHLLSGGRRIGHAATVGLCPWHHRGISQIPAREAEEMFGPSFARSPRAFRQRYGTETELLEMQNGLLQ